MSNAIKSSERVMRMGARIFNKGDMANLPKYGRIVSVPEEGYVHVDYDDGSQSLFMPTTLFLGPNARCKVVDG